MKEESENMEFTGERFVPEEHGNIELEHRHRYLQACQIAGGKVVLDIACGEGYGSAMLANTAEKVIGVDISSEAVEHARNRYKKANLDYRIGNCAEIPLADASVDLVVSFETIEHHDQHEQMMREIKRVLRPAGVLLISSPDKLHCSIETGYNNPYHVKELYQHEFKQLLDKYFKNTVYFGQRILYGSGIFPESLPTSTLSYWQDNATVQEAPGMIKPTFWIALASDGQLPAMASGVFEQPINDSEIIQSWSKVVAERDSRIDTLTRTVAERDSRIAEIGKTLTERDGLIDNLNQAVIERDNQIARIVSSRSWLITKPFRWIMRVIRGEFGLALEPVIRYTWMLLLKTYRSPFALPLLKYIPYTIKQRIRNALSRVQRAREVPVFSGERSENPLVSIIIPVYQHPDYLERCIASALNQTYRNLEVVVVDDASPDPRVTAILDTFKERPSFRLLRNETNLGISETQNRALIASSGEVVGFLDCDDYLAPEAVEVSLRYWKKNTVYSHSARINIDADDREVNRVCFQHLPRRDYFAENLEAMYATHFKMIRRDVFARIGLFDSRFDAAQDYDLLMRVAVHYPSDAFAYVPHFIYSHRLHRQQTTETANSRQALAVRQIKREAELRRAIQQGRFDRKLSFIMLSFGKHSQTLQAIQSLEATVSVPHEIVLFDNGSDAETVAFIKTHIDGRFDNVRVFYSAHNLGPAAGRKAALEHAGGDWFIVFDNDEIAEPGWLEEMLVRASIDEKIGAVTAKVVFPSREMQCCGGYFEYGPEDLVHLKLYGYREDAYNLATARFRECDWCPIGATLFTVNPKLFLHAGYPNVFEDAGVSMALKREGYRLMNSPASWVWHEHVSFRKDVEMGERYNRERYDPKRMLISISSFYKENGLIIFDEYVWRENNLNLKNMADLKLRLRQLATEN